MPASGLPVAARSPNCLYWIAEKDGSLYRCSLDGKIKELVVDCESLSKSRRQPNATLSGYPSLGSSLALGGVKRVGYSIEYIVVAYPRIKTNSDLSTAVATLRDKPVTLSAPYSVGQGSSQWRATLRPIGVEFEPHHEHSFISQIELSVAGGKCVSYTFANFEGEVIALLPEDIAILKDGRKVVLWTLMDDRKYLVAEGWFPVVWPRNLSEPERLKPVAKVKIRRSHYEYTLSHPRDLDRTIDELMGIKPTPENHGTANGKENKKTLSFAREGYLKAL